MVVQTPTITQDLAEDNLSGQQTTVTATEIEKQTTRSVVVEEGMVQQVPAIPLFLEAEDNDVSILQTVPIRIVKRKRAVNKIRTLFVTVAILLVSILFLGILAAIIVVVPSPAYKAEMLIVFFIAFSYIASAQMKRMDRVRQQVYLNKTQFVHTTKKRSASAQSKDEDRKHFKLIKQDTTAYLRALTMKDLKKGSCR